MYRSLQKGDRVSSIELPPSELETAQSRQHLSRFGLSEFRPGQQEVIETVLDGHDCLCIMPTGGGKSLCYQLPAIARQGITIVVSPLIALMKDQVDSLLRLGIRATFINSSLTGSDQNERLNELRAGRYDLVYIAPERLRNERFQEVIRDIKVQLLAVDEAHCISEWGHDFRPDYARLGKFRERLGFPQTIALTATATPTVQVDVVKQLQLREPRIFVTGFCRPNLRFESCAPRGDLEKMELLMEFLKETPGSGIVYAATRKRCEELVTLLKAKQARSVGFYHGGLEPDDRRNVQDAFMTGNVDIMVATNAFGMGINKSNLRFVVHYNLPGSLEAYYQEAGRAGRDGLPSRCLLLFMYADRFIQEFFIDNQYPPRDAISRVYEFLRAQPRNPIEATLQEVKEALQLNITAEGVGACEKILEKAGALLRMDSQQNRATIRLDSDLPTLVDLLPKEARTQRKVLRAVERIVADRRFEWVGVSPNRLQQETDLDREPLNRSLRELAKLQSFAYLPPFRGRAIHLLKRDIPFPKLGIDFSDLERRKRAEHEKLDRMVQYAEARRCRQWEILDYFGDQSKSNCGHCDNCAPNNPKHEGSVVDPAITPLIIEAVQIALSGAARTQGRIGKHLLAKMLCGSKSSKVSKLRLDELSTFGLLRELTQVEAAEFLDALVDSRLLEQGREDPEKPRIRLTSRGNSVMRGRETFSGPLSLSRQILARLNSRKPLARQATPEQMVIAVPVIVTPDIPAPEIRAPENSTAEVPAPAIEQTKPPEVDAVKQNALSKVIASSEPPIAVRIEPIPVRPNHYWTWRLMHDGYTFEECEIIRGLNSESLLDQLQRAAEEEMLVDLRWVFTQAQLDQLASLFPHDESLPIRLMVRKLPPELGIAHLQLYLKCRE